MWDLNDPWCLTALVAMGVLVAPIAIGVIIAPGRFFAGLVAMFNQGPDCDE